MTNDEFWYGEPRLAKAFRKAQSLKDDRLNQQLWLQGLYNYDALSVVISNAFGGKGGKKQDYLKEPIDLHPQNTMARKKAEARQKVVDYLNAWKKAWDKKQGVTNGEQRLDN